jgi:hypothetical protein
VYREARATGPDGCGVTVAEHPVERLQRLRYELFRMLGFMESEARALAAVEVDPEVVAEQLRQGCTFAQAVRIHT